jgi:hypothetical protein
VMSVNIFMPDSVYYTIRNSCFVVAETHTEHLS